MLKFGLLLVGVSEEIQGRNKLSTRIKWKNNYGSTPRVYAKLWLDIIEQNGDALAKRGWHHDRQGPPDTLHSTVSNTNTGQIVSTLCTLSQTWTYDGIPFGVGRPELVGTLPIHFNFRTPPLDALAVSPDGRTLATYAQDKVQSIQLWDISPLLPRSR